MEQIQDCVIVVVIIIIIIIIIIIYGIQKQFTVVTFIVFAFPFFLGGGCSKELSALRTTRYLETQVSLTYFACTKLATFAVLLTTILLAKDVSPEEALILLGWMELARNWSCGILPFAVMATAEMYYALQRIQVGQ